VKNIFLLITLCLIICLYPVTNTYAADNYDDDYTTTVIINDDDISEEINTVFKLIPIIRVLPLSITGTVVIGLFLFFKHNKANKKKSYKKYLEKDGYIVENKEAKYVKSDKKIIKNYYKK